VKSLDVVNDNKDGCSGGSIAVMRRKVQDERPTRHLHEHWAVALAFLPVELAPEVVEIEALGGLDIEHPQDRNRRMQSDIHAFKANHAEGESSICQPS
jgi:hypothetical protein